MSRWAPGSLTFDIADEGGGFDVDVTGYGTGLLGIADRLDAIGGSSEFNTEPAERTPLRGVLPLGAQR